jgi:hypothetical protein
MPLELKPTKAESVSPHVFMFYAQPKIGKSAICAGLTTQFMPGESIVINTQPGGYRFLEAVRVDAFNPKDFNAAVDEVKNDERIKLVIFDHLSSLDEWSEIVGTLEFMHKPQGKKWNARNPHNPSEGKYRPTDREWQSVHEMAEGFGYRYSREVMSNWLAEFISLGKRVVLVGHVKDKYISAAREGEMIATTELDLTGKVKYMFSKKVDSIAKLVAEGNKRYFSFEARNEHEVLGGHAKHLKGKILISEYDEEQDKVITHWDKIFID